MSVMDNIHKPDAKIRATDTQTMLKKRDKTPAIRFKRSGGAIWAMTTGRSAKMTKAMPPIQTIAAARWKNLNHSYIKTV
jgi:hypothetical protein